MSPNTKHSDLHVDRAGAEIANCLTTKQDACLVLQEHVASELLVLSEVKWPGRDCQSCLWDSTH